MDTTRSVVSRYRKLLLTSLALLPLTACSPDSINAVRGLLKEASASDSAQGTGPTSSPASGPEAGQGRKPENGAQNHAAQPGRPGLTVGAAAEVGVQSHNDGQSHPGETRPDKHECFCERVLIRVRWGQFSHNPAIPVWTPWKGRLKAENGQLRMLNTILYEPRDQILPQPPNTIGWMAYTKPHYDGFSAVMRFEHDLPAPKLILNTNYGHKVFSLPELRNIDFTRQVDPLGNGFQIKSYPLPRLQGHCQDDMPVPDHPEFRFPDEDIQLDEKQETMPTPGPEPELAPEAQAL